MIQRKQSAYLLLGSLALASVLLFWADIVVAAFPGYASAAFGAGALTCLLGIVAIFLYGNRERQRAMALAAQIGALLWMGLFTAVPWHGLFTPAPWLGGGRPFDPATSSLLPMALLVCAYGFFWLARRAIHADIALVRSADRIR